MFHSFLYVPAEPCTLFPWNVQSCLERLESKCAKLEQLKKKKGGGEEMESSPAQIRRSVPSSRKGGLPRSNPPLMGRVQAECQEQPQAADFQSRLTTNPLPEKQPGSSGIMKPTDTATRERGTAKQMETPDAAL